MEVQSPVKEYPFGEKHEMVVDRLCIEVDRVVQRSESEKPRWEREMHVLLDVVNRISELQQRTDQERQREVRCLEHEENYKNVVDAFCDCVRSALDGEANAHEAAVLLRDMIQRAHARLNLSWLLRGGANSGGGAAAIDFDSVRTVSMTLLCTNSACG